MPDATGEWLVEFEDMSKHTAYERFANVNDAIPFLHKVLGTGQRPRLYRETPITLTIDVGGEAPVKAPRKRRKNSPPADKPGSDAPTGPGNGAAGELKEGAAGPDAQDVNGADTSGAPAPLPNTAGTSNPAGPYSCEANFDGDPKCPGPLMWDHVTCGYFCGLHLTAIPPSGRVELHRRHASRNRPVRVAHAG